MARKSLPVISITIIMLLVLATAGVAYGLWSEKLVIDGTVYTGDVDVAFSGPYTFEAVNVNGKYQLEPRVKDQYAECEAYSYDFDPGSNGNEGIDITVKGAYPGDVCYVMFDVHSTGSVPVHVTHPYAPEDNAPAWVQVHSCYPNWVQLHRGQSVWSKIWIEFDNDSGVEENSEYTFHFEIDALQWNEAPPTGAMMSTLAATSCGVPDGLAVPEGFTVFTPEE